MLSACVGVQWMLLRHLFHPLNQIQTSWRISTGMWYNPGSNRAGTHKIEASKNIILRHEPISWYLKNDCLHLFSKKYIGRWPCGRWKVQLFVYLVGPYWTVLCRIIGIFVHTRISIQWRKYVGISTDRTSSPTDRYSATVILYVLHK